MNVFSLQGTKEHQDASTILQLRIQCTNRHSIIQITLAIHDISM